MRYRLLGALSLISLAMTTGCGNRQETTSSIASDGSRDAADPAVDGTAIKGDPYDVAEPKLTDKDEPANLPTDEEVIASTYTDPGKRVATIFLRGGSAKHCVKWNLTVFDEESAITLVTPKKLEEKRQGDSIKQDGDQIVVATQTIGGRDGAKMLVTDGDMLRIRGDVSNCAGTKKETIDVRTKISTLTSRQVFKGDKLKDDGTGKTHLFLRISKVKEDKKEKKNGGSGKATAKP